MRKIQKKIITVSGLYVIKTHVTLYEKLIFFWLRKYTFSNFLHELAYLEVHFKRHLKNSQYVIYRI